MSTLRQALYGIALLGALALLIWGQQQRINTAESQTDLAKSAAKTAREDADRNLATATTLTDPDRRKESNPSIFTNWA